MPATPQPPPADAPAAARLGYALRQRRQAMPGIRNREQLAERLGYSVAVVKAVENGVYRAGLHRYLSRWEALFGLDSELQQLWQEARTAAWPPHLASEDDHAHHGLDHGGADPMSGVAPWELAEVLTRSWLSPIALDYMEQATYGCAARYPSSAPGSLWPAVNAQLRQLHTALGHPQTLAVRRRAVVLVGVLAGISGNLLIDLGREHEAAASFAVGKLAGTEAEDPDLTAWVLATQSIGPFFSGHPHHAVRLLEEAAEYATRGSSARRRAWIAALQARGYAAIGAADRALSALQDAHTALGSAEAPRGADFFDAARLEGLAGSSYLLAGDTSRAARTLTAARGDRAPTDAKGRALLTLDLAACRLLDDEGDEACRLVEEALDLAAGSVVDPIASRARTLRAAAGQAASPTARAQLDLRLAQLPP